MPSVGWVTRVDRSYFAWRASNDLSRSPNGRIRRSRHEPRRGLLEFRPRFAPNSPPSRATPPGQPGNAPQNGAEWFEYKYAPLPLRCTLLTELASIAVRSMFAPSYVLAGASQIIGKAGHFATGRCGPHRAANPASAGSLARRLLPRARPRNGLSKECLRILRHGRPGAPCALHPGPRLAFDPLGGHPAVGSG